MEPRQKGQVTINMIRSCSTFSFCPPPHPAQSPARPPFWLASDPSSSQGAASDVLLFLNYEANTGYHAVECLFDIMAFQSTSLHEHHPVFTGKLLAMFVCINRLLHLSDRYCLRSDLLPTIKHTISSLPQFRNSFSHLSKFQKDEARVISQTKSAPTAPRQQALAIDRYLSWPAVSQICTLMVLSSMLTTLEANSTPMVVLDSKLNSFLVNFEMMLDLPTPESPTSTILS